MVSLFTVLSTTNKGLRFEPASYIVGINVVKAIVVTVIWDSPSGCIRGMTIMAVVI